MRIIGLFPRAAGARRFRECHKVNNSIRLGALSQTDLKRIEVERIYTN